MALIAGVQAPSGRVMGHAGAFVGAGEKKAAGKVRALEDVGVVITNHPSKFGEGMKRLLGNGSHWTSVSDLQGPSQKPEIFGAKTLTRGATITTVQRPATKHAHRSRASKILL